MGVQGVPVWIDGDERTRAWLRSQLAGRLSLSSMVADRLHPRVEVSVLVSSDADRGKLENLDTGGLWVGAGVPQVQGILVGIVRDFLSRHDGGAALFEHGLLKPTDPVVRRLPKWAFAGDEVYSWVDASDDEASIRSAVVAAWNFRFTGFLTSVQPSPDVAHDHQLKVADLENLAKLTSGVFIDAFDAESLVAAWLRPSAAGNPWAPVR